ncbi:MAG: type II toxin-antitoxin system RelE/ParE family toxin, partial [Gammaproteobacteria bacterium]
INMKQTKEIRYYTGLNGKSPFRDWLENLKDNTIRARVERRIERMAFGNYGDYKTVGNGIFESRLMFGAGYRIYWIVQDDDLIILLCGGDKSTQNHDIKLAKEFLKQLSKSL